MRTYCFVENTLEDIERAGFLVLTPETAQRNAIQTRDGLPYPKCEALLHFVDNNLWLVMPVTERDWYIILKNSGLTVHEDAEELELVKPTIASAYLYQKDTEGKTVGEKRLPCVIGNDDPIQATLKRIPIGDIGNIGEIIKK